MLICFPFVSDTNTSSISRPYDQSGTIIISEEVPLSGEISFSSLDIQVVNILNTYRENAGLGALVFTESLGSAASVRAEECSQLFSHTRPNGEDWYTVNSSICYGENLAKGYSTAEEAVSAWLNSPTHKELIYDISYVSCGIGHYTTSNGTVYIACEFGY